MNAPALIDTHCHLDFESYDGDRPAVLFRAREAGVIAVINPAVDLASSAAICQLAASEPLIFGAVGIHPNSSTDFVAAQVDELRALARQPRVVAIGEIGLDYYRDRSPRQTQHRALEAQLELAAALALPVILHNREATADVLAILRGWVGSLPADHPLRGRPGVLHSFSGTADDAAQAVELGFYVGITGPITFKNADALRRVAAALPDDRLLIETDGPFLTPHPHRGERNEPAYVRLVADRIAGVRLSAYETVAAQTTRNAIRLFALPVHG
ncbi:MAG: TatD family hydrolase [Anaerolineae bacterium]|nr:TatD family hydrolase [Anaerolineae bacterium]